MEAMRGQAWTDGVPLSVDERAAPQGRGVTDPFLQTAAGDSSRSLQHIDDIRSLYAPLAMHDSATSGPLLLTFIYKVRPLMVGFMSATRTI